MNGDPSLPEIRSSIQIALQGRFGLGGVADVRDDGLTFRVHLGPALFSLLAVLALKAKECTPEQIRNWGGFIPVRDLCDQLKARTQGSARPLYPGPNGLFGYVKRLRSRLQIPGLVEYERYLGYRLVILPENVTVEFLDGRLKASPIAPTLDAEPHRDLPR
jgi:hypothetical protein